MRSTSVKGTAGRYIAAYPAGHPFAVHQDQDPFAAHALQPYVAAHAGFRELKPRAFQYLVQRIRSGVLYVLPVQDLRLDRSLGDILLAPRAGDRDGTQVQRNGRVLPFRVALSLSRGLPLRERGDDEKPEEEGASGRNTLGSHVPPP
jgi:hypothetical protein